MLTRLLFVSLIFGFLVTYSYADACSNIFNTIKTSGHSSLEKIYLSLYWKGCVWEGVGDRIKTATYWPPQLFWPSQPFFPVLLGCSTGGLGPSLCWDMVLIPASFLQLIWTSCHRGYIIIWPPPTSCERHICTQFNLSTVKVIPWSPDIFDRMHLLFTLVHFFFWQLGRGPICNTSFDGFKIRIF